MKYNKTKQHEKNMKKMPQWQVKKDNFQKMKGWLKSK